MRRKKVILHMDGDAFFVGVEVAKNPKLKDLPVVTGEEKGIVSALSYEAKALGVVRGMPIFQIKKLFPTVIILPGDYKSYTKFSQMMFDIVRRYADDVEEYSIDECFADLTGLDLPLKMSYLEIAQRIKKEINEEMDLSISIGLAPSKVLAKVASKWVKPNGLTVIEKDTAEDFLKKTSIGSVWGIGPQTSRSLRTKGIDTAYDLVQKSEAWISENLSKPYKVIWHELQGTSIMSIDSVTKNKFSSIQKTRTFHPATNDKSFLLSQLSKNIEEACTKARHYKLVPQAISFFLKTKEFEYSGTSLKLLTATNAPESLISIIQEEFNKVYKKGSIYRTTGVTLRGLKDASLVQEDLFGSRSATNKFETIHTQIDALEHKFGKKMVYLASTHKAIKNKKLGTDSEDLDRDLLFL